jgi:hypothetical protein
MELGMTAYREECLATLLGDFVICDIVTTVIQTAAFFTPTLNDGSDFVLQSAVNNCGSLGRLGNS